MTDDESGFDALRSVSDPFGELRWSDVLARVPSTKAPRRLPRPLRLVAVAAPILAGLGVFAAVAVIVGSRHPTTDAPPPATTPAPKAIGNQASSRVPQLLDGRISAPPRRIALSTLDPGSRRLLQRVGPNPTIVAVGGPDGSGVTHAFVTGPRGECVVEILREAVGSECGVVNSFRGTRIVVNESDASAPMTRTTSTKTAPGAGATATPATLRVLSFSGVAVDGIVSVRLSLATGPIDVPVHDNVFWLDPKAIPKSPPGRGAVVGVAADGSTIAANDPTPGTETLFIRYAAEMKLPASAVPAVGPNLPKAGTALVGVVALRGLADGSRLGFVVYRGSNGAVCRFRYQTAARSLGPVGGKANGGHVCDTKPVDSVRIDTQSIIHTQTGAGDTIYFVTAPIAADAMVIADSKGHQTRYRLSGAPNPEIPGLQALLFERPDSAPGIAKITIMEGNRVLPPISR